MKFAGLPRLHRGKVVTELVEGGFLVESLNGGGFYTVESLDDV
ncbi:hypothetical protein [Haloferax larsenii]|uniref:Uncharacterized protein n=1 Tax=Haloferax larsenii TaxID=302484 RepID=A0A1H7N7J5_HALLR|nr:hypothetical protein [Haloferax larsenii]SEL18945.1 hypothetical protein SAMN04488691_103202 [Haloferax larsenii]